jgi:2-polyprenyl-3-methyl-5-hydroxy-6-metoxy-1,4-benzoquinol methylase
MRCLLCESERSHLVWQENGSQIKRCDGCGVLYAVTPHSQGELNTLYEEGKLTGVPTEQIGRTDAPPQDWKQQEHQFLLDRLRHFGANGGALLDVGAFDGTFMGNAKMSGFDPTGIEPLREAYLHVRDSLGLNVVHGDLLSAALPAESFAAVSLLDVIEHVADPVEELREAYRVLKPDGIPVMTTPNAAGLIQKVVGTKRKIFGQAWCPIDNVPWHLWGFTPPTIRLCVEKAGYRVESVDSLQPSPLSSNRGSGSTRGKKMALWAVAEASKLLDMSDRMAIFARKGAASRS